MGLHNPVDEEREADSSSVEETVTRSWALADGVSTVVQSAIATVVLEPIDWVRSIDTLPETLQDNVVKSEDKALPSPTVEDVRVTVLSEHAGTEVPTNDEPNRSVFDKDALGAIWSGDAPEHDLVLLTEETPRRAYVCSAQPVLITRLVTDVFGEGETFMREYTDKEQLQRLRKFRQQSVELTYEDDYVVTAAPSTLLGRLRQSIMPRRPESIGRPVEDVPLRREDINEIAEELFTENDSSDGIPEQDWVTVTMNHDKEDGVIKLQSEDDSRLWVFHTSDNVLTDDNDIAFFKQLGFDKLEQDSATLKAVEVSDATEPRDWWKRNEAGEWWLAPVTVHQA